MNKSATIHPIDDQLLVRRADAKDSEEITADTVFRGRIAALGPGMPTITGERSALSVLSQDGRALVRVEVGDGIMYRQEAAQQITLESGAFDLIRFRDAIAIMKSDDKQ